jgi:hypothetical protein
MRRASASAWSLTTNLFSPRATASRDYEKKLPFTPATISPIASNTKLFSAVSAGMLVEANASKPLIWQVRNISKDFGVCQP